MIPWRDIELSDKERVEKLICASGCHSADYSFAVMYMWKHEYEPQLCFVGNRLLVGGETWDKYSYPKGDGDVRPAMETLFEDAHSKGKKLMLRGLTDKTLEEFLPIYGDKFDIIEDRNDADYIYTAAKLCKLAGRKLSSKRNHINKFEKNGEWEFVKINAGNMHIARKFVAEFYKEKGNPDLDSEAIAIDNMFNNYVALGFIGGLLYQKGVPVAFSAGTRLDDVTFDVHFEKALPHIEGAYTMINREFARLVVSEIPEIELFNREEDMGLEGLRKSKLSYHPDILLMKYFAREKA